jgi:hypothetical protein
LEFQKLKNDPLARMQAYAELKEDPDNGTAIVLFSWLVRLFVSFLEVVPVAAKMLFCPPSVYGTIVKAEVLRERRRAERMVVESELRDVEPVDKYPARSRASADAMSAKPRRIPEVILGKRGESATPAVG